MVGLEMTVLSDSGIVVENAYHRLDYIEGKQEVISFNVKTYPSYSDFLKNKKLTPLTSKYYFFKPNLNQDSDNLFKQSYDHLKSLGEYNTATDVIDS